MESLLTQIGSTRQAHTSKSRKAINHTNSRPDRKDFMFGCHNVTTLKSQFLWTMKVIVWYLQKWIPYLVHFRRQETCSSQVSQTKVKHWQGCICRIQKRQEEEKLHIFPLTSNKCSFKPELTLFYYQNSDQRSQMFPKTHTTKIRGY